MGRVGGRRRCDAEAPCRLTIDLDVRLQTAILKVARDVGELRQMRQSVDETRHPRRQLVDVRRIERELVKAAPQVLRNSYIEGRKERGLLFKTVRQAIIDPYVRKQLAA